MTPQEADPRPTSFPTPPRERHRKTGTEKPQPPRELIVTGHGGGGLLTRRLIRDFFLRALDNPVLRTLDDGACVTIPETDLVLTTDSYVVRPLFFPGGDIGTLAICGTVNDLAMQGASPRYMTLGMILEEGLPLEDLRRVVHSMAETVRRCGIWVVAGDTKVVERLADDAPGLLINTTGLGVRRPGVNVAVSHAKPGDVVLLSGPIGDHGLAVLGAREGIGWQTGLTSDVAPLWPMIEKLLDAVPDVHVLRDPTRGGVAAALVEIAEASRCGIRVREEAIPIRDPVRGACDVLGLDPLHVANEGKAVIVCHARDAPRALDALRQSEEGRDAVLIGEVTDSHPGMVVLETRLGGERPILLPTGEDLPRIC